MPKGFISVFQKCLEEEVQKSAELQAFVGQMEAAKHLFLFQSVFVPLAREVKESVQDMLWFVGGSVCLADQAAKEAGERLWRMSSEAAAFPVVQVGRLLHRGVLKIGRVLCKGKEYRHPIDIHPWIKGGQKGSSACTYGTMRSFIPAVIASAKYTDLIKQYSPYAWRHLNTGYSTGELLGVHGVSIKQGAQPQVSFQSDMYNEARDRVFKAQSKWTLDKVQDSDEAGYRIHKADIAEILE
ncbi:hypothetical protein NECID01_0812 [Nematocida sp. AWRm77]|nr:hypothetical protein NECID01_0812 [Nematocida sp. AWRm77]